MDVANQFRRSFARITGLYIEMIVLELSPGEEARERQWAQS